MVLPILYQDEQYIAINKPNGLLVHRTRISEETKVFALQLLRDQLGQRVYPVHRLDRPTSGILLFSLNSEAVQPMMTAFEERQVKKTYLAIVRGYTAEREEIDHPLVAENKKESQPAITHYTRMATVELPIAVNRYPTSRYSLVKVMPITGRMHQIRKHFAHIRHYIIGDKKHGDWRHNLMFSEQFGSSNLLLHARKLEFIHPFTRKEIIIEAPIPDNMLRLCERFGWTNALP